MNRALIIFMAVLLLFWGNSELLITDVVEANYVLTAKELKVFCRKVHPGAAKMLCPIRYLTIKIIIMLLSIEIKLKNSMKLLIEAGKLLTM